MSKKNSSIKHSRKHAESSDFPAGCVPVDVFKKEFFRRLRRRYKIYVVRAEHAGDYKLNVYFADGTMQTVDFEPFFYKSHIRSTINTTTPSVFWSSKSKTTPLCGAMTGI